MALSAQKVDDSLQNEIPLLPAPPLITHIKTPAIVKAVYMTSWAAGTASFQKRIFDILDTTEVNSVVIDIKDYSGKLAFKTPNNTYLTEFGSEENRIPDIVGLLQTLHEKNIYVIGRIAVFQDPYFVQKFPDLAVKRKSDGGVWKDKKGISWIDVGAKEVWDYVIAISKEAHSLGFDELNFDYIRFPSDGNMSDIYYPKSHGREKPVVMREFFSYLYDNLKLNLGSQGVGSVKNEDEKKDEIMISADFFGLTTTSKDDLNIGQVFEDALPFFDFVSPMVYPSHYPPTYNGYKNPADHPYEIVKFAMDSAVLRATNASTTPQKIRPWLQDFDLGADYTKDMVRAQMKATYDAGLTSWMLWDPRNIYTKEALLKE